MTAKMWIALATAGSAALLLGAFGFQYIGGLAPCALCLWQRWPHAVALGFGAVGLAMPSAALAILGALSAGTSGAIGLYHTGVERDWWDGPSTCSAGPIGGVTPEQLMEQILAAPLVRCDEVPWEMLGLSMASWNAVISFALMGFWLMAARAG